MSGQPGREDAVEHVRPPPDRLEEPLGVSQPHHVSRLALRELGEAGIEGKAAFRDSPTDSPPIPKPETRGPRSCAALRSEIRVDPALHDPKQRLIGLVCARRQRSAQRKVAPTPPRPVRLAGRPTHTSRAMAMSGASSS